MNEHRESYDTGASAQAANVDVHNAWTIYGLERNGVEAKAPLAMHSRPQDWGDPRWHYELFTFTWETAPDGKRYVNHCHCWTDLKRERGEYAQLFAALIAQILMPGTPKELCGREYLQEEDFWQRKWGTKPPIYQEDDGWATKA